jgi:hypothetical protein
MTGRVVDVVEGLDLSELVRAYAGRGSDADHPATLLSLLTTRSQGRDQTVPELQSGEGCSLRTWYLQRIICIRHPSRNIPLTVKHTPDFDLI